MPDGISNSARPCYEIRVLGRIDPRWKDWFGGMSSITLPSSEGPALTVLTGPLADQAALFGVLSRIRDLGLRLVSVNPMTSQQNKDDH